MLSRNIRGCNHPCAAGGKFATLSPAARRRYEPRHRGRSRRQPSRRRPPRRWCRRWYRYRQRWPRWRQQSPGGGTGCGGCVGGTGWALGGVWQVATLSNPDCGASNTSRALFHVHRLLLPPLRQHASTRVQVRGRGHVLFGIVLFSRAKVQEGAIGPTTWTRTWARGLHASCPWPELTGFFGVRPSRAARLSAAARLSVAGYPRPPCRANSKMSATHCALASESCGTRAAAAPALRSHRPDSRSGGHHRRLSACACARCRRSSPPASSRA